MPHSASHSSSSSAAYILPSHRFDPSDSSFQDEPLISPSSPGMFAQNNTTSGTNLPSNNPHTKLNKPVLLSTSPTSPANPSHHYQNLLVAALAEFAGTFMFLFFAFGGTSVANNSDAALDADLTNKFGGIAQAPDTSVLLYVTLGLYLIGTISWPRACLCFVSQMLAGMAAAGVIQAILPGPLAVSTTLGVGVTPTRGVFLEMFLTSLLVFTIFMLAAEKHKATFLAPIGIGLALFVAELVGVFFTGGSLNPARSFGPCVVTMNFPGYHYIYWIGPFMGTLLAWAMYLIVKSVEYERINPGQDFDDHEAALFEPSGDPEDEANVHRPVISRTRLREAREAKRLEKEEEKIEKQRRKEQWKDRGGSVASWWLNESRKSVFGNMGRSEESGDKA
ncbi:aquaporin-like protein [Stemphylium lycopersici]|nr:hypothetical protein TW65_09250 [Stemphylium lycopersici]RAR12473.1 aquaporin-like protein [Stemphylium lycopersici]